MNSELKRASWLELFYDVAFVALIAQLTHFAVEFHRSIEDILHLGIVGYAIFIAWFSTTANRNLQPKESGADKVLVQFQMIGAFLMSVSMYGVFHNDYVGFFVVLGSLRLLQSFTLLKMYWLYPESRPATYNLLQGNIIGSLLWMICAVFPNPVHFIIAFMALAVDILTPLTRGEGNTIRYLNIYHLQERLGLFLMLVMGESMIVVALANTATELSVTEPLVLLSGLAMMISLWWLYFEHSDRHLGERPRSLFLYLHAHGFLFGSLILLSVGYKLILEKSATEGLFFVLLGSIGIATLIAIIRATLYKMYGRLVIVGVIVFVVLLELVFVGLIQDRVIEAIGSTAFLFILVALLDYSGVFSKIGRVRHKPLSD